MKAALLAPLYVSLSWILTVSYEIFTNSALNTVSLVLNNFWPSAAAWLAANIQIVSFTYSFSWIFLLSAIVPGLILGKERSAIVQYLFCMILTLLALVAENIISIDNEVQSIWGVSFLLERPIFAFVYLAIPYVVMVSLDLRNVRKRSKRRQNLLQ